MRELGESCQHPPLGRSMSVDEILLSDEKELALRSRCMSADDADEPSLLPSKRTLAYSDEWSRWLSTPGSAKDVRPKSSNGTEGDDDQGSVDSTNAYYDQTDFLPTNWTHAVNMIPPMGLAFVAGGFALTHPLIFFAGTVAAYGTMHAAGACSDCAADGYPCMWNQEQQEDPEQENKLPSEASRYGETSSEITLESSGDESNHRLDAIMSAPLASETEPSECAAPLPTNSDQSESSLLKQNPLEWLKKYYPKLDHVAVENAQFFGLNAVEFFNVFFANDAPFSCQEIHKQRGDRDIKYGSWQALDDKLKPSLHAKGSSCADEKVSSFLRERVLQFKAKTNSYFGPPFADTTKVQRVLMASKQLMVLESKTTVKNIPMCDKFYVMERWVITAEKQVQGGIRQYVSSLSVYSQVFFTKSCPFESQIETKSTSSIVEISNAWCGMAKAALQLTEASRMKRIQRCETNDWEHLDDDASFEEGELNETALMTGDEESIEVQHMGLCQSFVLGDVSEKENAEPSVDVVNMPTTSTKGLGSRMRTSSMGSFGKMGRSITNYVRKRTLSPELA